MENELLDWQKRLLEEREQLLGRTLKLKKFIDNPDSKLNNQEWEMISHQRNLMQEYLHILTKRCNYYKLIDTPDLNIY